MARAAPLSAARRVLSANVVASDATPSPIAATLLYSHDAGTSWQASLLAPGHSRSSAAQVATSGARAVRCHVVVQDELYGIGPLTVEATPAGRTRG
jgi:hypothetical protein